MDPTLKDDMLLLGLYIFWNPAILDWRTWRKFGEHGESLENMEKHGKNGKHQPDELQGEQVQLYLMISL